MHYSLWKEGLREFKLEGILVFSLLYRHSFYSINLCIFKLECEAMHRYYVLKLR